MHSASPLATSQKHLTPLDVITGYQPVPNRQDVALLLAEAMREQGWQGTPLEIRRQARNRRRLAKTAEKVKRVGEWDRMGRVLGMGESWWAGVYQLDEDEEDEDAPMNGERDEDLAADEIAPEEIYVSLLYSDPATKSLIFYIPRPHHEITPTCLCFPSPLSLLFFNPSLSMPIPLYTLPPEDPLPPMPSISLRASLASTAMPRGLMPS